MKNILAEDVVRTADDRRTIDVQAVIEAAPRHSGRLIEVRAVLGGEVGAA